MGSAALEVEVGEDTLPMPYPLTRCRETELCYIIKFCVKLKKPKREAYLMLEEAYGDEMNDPNKFLWFNRFFEGNEQVKDESRSGAPSSVRNEENVEEVRMQMLQDC